MLKRDIRLLAVLTLFEAKRYKAYPTEVIAVLVGKVIEIIMYVTFWTLVARYAAGSTISVTGIVSYYLIINGIATVFSTEFGIGSQFIKMVKFGEFNQVLIKPINPFLVPIAQRTGRNLLSIALSFAQILIGMYIGGGMKGWGLVMLPFAVFNALIINLSFNLIVGTLSFFFVEAGGFKNAFAHVLRLCGGQTIPLFLMPAWLATALQFTPFPAAEYQLAAILQGQHPVAPVFIFVGVMWSVILFASAVIFWRFGLAKYEAVGV